MNYAQRTDRVADFRVSYAWLPFHTHGFNQQPFQHMRCDFAYADDPPDQAYMIWPEFEDSERNPLPEGASVPLIGTATMWILDDALRHSVHRARISPGVRGFLVVGTHRVATAEVLQVIGLA